MVNVSAQTLTLLNIFNPQSLTDYDISLIKSEWNRLLSKVKNLPGDHRYLPESMQNLFNNYATLVDSSLKNSDYVYALIQTLQDAETALEAMEQSGQLKELVKEGQIETPGMIAERLLRSKKIHDYSIDVETKRVAQLIQLSALANKTAIAQKKYMYAVLEQQPSSWMYQLAYAQRGQAYAESLVDAERKHKFLQLQADVLFDDILTSPQTSQRERILKLLGRRGVDVRTDIIENIASMSDTMRSVQNEAARKDIAMKLKEDLIAKIITTLPIQYLQNDALMKDLCAYLTKETVMNSLNPNQQIATIMQSTLAQHNIRMSMTDALRLSNQTINSLSITTEAIRMIPILQIYEGDAKFEESAQQTSQFLQGFIVGDGSYIKQLANTVVFNSIDAAVDALYEQENPNTKTQINETLYEILRKNNIALDQLSIEAITDIILSDHAAQQGKNLAEVARNTLFKLASDPHFPGLEGLLNDDKSAIQMKHLEELEQLSSNETDFSAMAQEKITQAVADTLLQTYAFLPSDTYQQLASDIAASIQAASPGVNYQEMIESSVRQAITDIPAETQNTLQQSAFQQETFTDVVSEKIIEGLLLTYAGSLPEDQQQQLLQQVSGKQILSYLRSLPVEQRKTEVDVIITAAIRDGLQPIAHQQAKKVVETMRTPDIIALAREVHIPPEDQIPTRIMNPLAKLTDTEQTSQIFLNRGRNASTMAETISAFGETFHTLREALEDKKDHNQQMEKMVSGSHSKTHDHELSSGQAVLGWMFATGSFLANMVVFMITPFGTVYKILFKKQMDAFVAKITFKTWRDRQKKRFTDFITNNVAAPVKNWVNKLNVKVNAFLSRQIHRLTDPVRNWFQRRTRSFLISLLHLKQRDRWLQYSLGQIFSSWLRMKIRQKYPNLASIFFSKYGKSIYLKNMFNSRFPKTYRLLSSFFHPLYKGYKFFSSYLKKAMRFVLKSGLIKLFGAMGGFIGGPIGMIIGLGIGSGIIGGMRFIGNIITGKLNLQELQIAVQTWTRNTLLILSLITIIVIVILNFSFLVTVAEVAPQIALTQDQINSGQSIFPTSAITPFPQTTPRPPDINGLVYYSQRDPVWANYPPFEQHPFSCTIAENGCGPTTLAMMLSSNGITCDPKCVVDKYYGGVVGSRIVTENYSYCVGTLMQTANYHLTNNGFQVQLIFSADDNAGKSYNEVYPQLRAMIDSGWTVFGRANINNILHFFWIVKADDNGLYSMDPWYGYRKPYPINVNPAYWSDVGISSFKWLTAYAIKKI